MNNEDSKAIYFISVASTLSGIHQQTIRTYEQKGLIKPFRTGGGTRRYSQEDDGTHKKCHPKPARHLDLCKKKSP